MGEFSATYAEGYKKGARSMGRLIGVILDALNREEDDRFRAAALLAASKILRNGGKDEAERIATLVGLIASKGLRRLDRCASCRRLLGDCDCDCEEMCQTCRAYDEEHLRDYRLGMRIREMVTEDEG